jgi:hypothetical protein
MNAKSYNFLLKQNKQLLKQAVVPVPLLHYLNFGNQGKAKMIRNQRPSSQELGAVGSLFQSIPMLR